MENEFIGAKVALFIGCKLLITLRDDFAHIPFPNVWDLPGGGSEAGETPLETMNREVLEEVGLIIPSEAIVWERNYPASIDPSQRSWFFVAMMPAGFEAGIVFGDEGQGWQLIELDEFLAMSNVVPSFAPRLRDWLAQGGFALLDGPAGDRAL